MATEFQTHMLELPAAAAGQRLDQALAAALPQYSRARLQRWIRAGAVRLGGQAARARDRVRGGEQVVVEAQFEADDGVAPSHCRWRSSTRMRDLLVLNKPAGLVVHPGAGNRAHTLQNALLAHDAALARVPRAGPGASARQGHQRAAGGGAHAGGAHAAGGSASRAREVGREYLALVWGRPTGGAPHR